MVVMKLGSLLEMVKTNSSFSTVCHLNLNILYRPSILLHTVLATVKTNCCFFKLRRIVSQFMTCLTCKIGQLCLSRQVKCHLDYILTKLGKSCISIME